MGSIGSSRRYHVAALFRQINRGVIGATFRVNELSKSPLGFCAMQFLARKSDLIRYYSLSHGNIFLRLTKLGKIRQFRTLLPCCHQEVWSLMVLSNFHRAFYTSSLYFRCQGSEYATCGPVACKFSTYFDQTSYSVIKTYKMATISELL